MYKHLSQGLSGHSRSGNRHPLCRLLRLIRKGVPSTLSSQRPLRTAPCPGEARGSPSLCSPPSPAAYSNVTQETAKSGRCTLRQLFHAIQRFTCPKMRCLRAAVGALGSSSSSRAIRAFSALRAGRRKSPPAAAALLPSAPAPTRAPRPCPASPPHTTTPPWRPSASRSSPRWKSCARPPCRRASRRRIALRSAGSGSRRFCASTAVAAAAATASPMPTATTSVAAASVPVGAGRGGGSGGPFR